MKRTLVVYSGPSSTQEEEKVELYQKNMHYFIQHGGIILDANATTSSGMECNTHDTIIVVGQEFFSKYHAMVEQWKQQQTKLQTRGGTSSPRCQASGSGPLVRVVARRSVCYDMETARMAFTGELGVSIKDYDYFVFVNCGLTGPGVMTEKHLPQPIGGQDPTSNNPTKESSIRSSSILPWTLAFTSRLNDQVKMSGLSLNMYGFDKRKQQPHIQSFLYALDRKGIEIIQGANSLFDCLQLPPLSARHHRNNKQYTPEELMFHEIVMRYELGLSTAILEAGYAIAPLLHPRQPKCTHVTKADILEDPNNQNKAMDPNQKCRNFDMWYTQPLEHLYHGRIPTLNETLFFKSSRFVTPEIATLIQYTGQTNFVTEFSENRPAYEMTWFGQITDE